jgi:Fe-S cluster assembly protein SufB
MSDEKKWIEKRIQETYPYGFSSPIAMDRVASGLNQAIIREISKRKEEPAWLLEARLRAFAHWKTLLPPQWANITHKPIDFEAICYYAAPKKQAKYANMDEVDPEIRATFERLGIPLAEQKVLAGVVVDVVLDSVSVTTTFRKKLAELGIIFCSFSQAVREHPALVKQYMGRVVPMKDNYYAALNAAVFTDGSFCYIPAGVRCPMELSTYFRINAAGTGQFERTLIIAEEGAYVSYLEGCTAPMREEHQLHAAVVEIYAKAEAEVRYATVQNWYPGDAQGRGGVYNFVTKRGLCAGERSKISWTQVETGSAITWKYPSCILQGEGSVGEFYSIALTKGAQQADTGTKMIHIGKGTRSRIISKGISAGKSRNSYRGLVHIAPKASDAYNFSQCDSLLLGKECGAYTFPYITGNNATAQVAHEATTSRISEEQLFYCQARGIEEEPATALIVVGYCKEVLQWLPMEFAVEARKLLELSLEGSIG